MDIASLAGAITKTSGNGDDSVFEFIGSTETVDRAGDIVRQNWELDHFKANGVILWGHQHSELPIGKAIDTTVEQTANGPRLRLKVKFVPESIFPFAGRVRKMVEAGFLNAVSVGFKPLERADLNDEQREELGVGRFGQVFERAELLETSIVNVPANPDAGRLKAAGIDEAEYAALTNVKSETFMEGIDSLSKCLDNVEAFLNESETRGAVTEGADESTPQGTEAKGLIETIERIAGGIIKSMDALTHALVDAQDKGVITLNGKVKAADSPSEGETDDSDVSGNEKDLEDLLAATSELKELV